MKASILVLLGSLFSHQAFAQAVCSSSCSPDADTACARLMSYDLNSNSWNEVCSSPLDADGKYSFEDAGSDLQGQLNAILDQGGQLAVFSSGGENRGLRPRKRLIDSANLSSPENIDADLDSTVDAVIKTNMIDAIVQKADALKEELSRSESEMNLKMNLGLLSASEIIESRSKQEVLKGKLNALSTAQGDREALKAILPNYLVEVDQAVGPSSELAATNLRGRVKKSLELMSGFSDDDHRLIVNAYLDALKSGGNVDQGIAVLKYAHEASASLPQEQMDYVRQTIDMVFKKFEMSLAGSAPNPNFLEADPFVRLTIQDFAFSALSFATEGKILFESFLRIGDITFGECKAGNSKSSGNCKYGQMGVGAASVLREIKEKAIGNPYPSFSQLSPSSQGVVQVIFRSLDSSVAKMNSESEINRALAAVDSKLQQEFEDSVHRARDRFVVEPGTIKMLKKYGDLVSSYVRYSEAVLIEAKGELEAGAALDVSRASLATFPQDQLDEMNLLGNDLREKWKAAVYQACDERGNPNLMNYFSSVPLPLVPGIQEIDLGFEADSVEMAELISVLGSRFSQLPEVVEAEQTYIGHLYGAVSIDFSNRGGSLSQESSRKQYDEMFQAAQSRGNLRSLWIEYSKAVRPEADQAVANKLGVSVDLMKSLDVSEKAPLSVNALYAHRKYVGDSVSLKMFKERMSGLEIGSLMLRISLLGFSYPDTPAAQGPLYGELKRLREILYQQASSPNDPALSDALAQQLLILGQVRAEETKKLEEIIYNVADARPKVDGVASLLGISAEELSVKAVSDGALLSPDMMGVLTIIMGENPNFQGFNF